MKAFAQEQQAITDMEAEAQTLNAQMEELREEHGGEDGLLANAMDDKQRISKKNLQEAIKELGKKDADNTEEYEILHRYKKLMEQEADIQGNVKTALKELEIAIIKQYPLLSIDEVKTVVVDKKWMANLEQRIKTEMDNISHRLTQRIKELAERYETPLPLLSKKVEELTGKVDAHLKQMNFTW